MEKKPIINLSIADKGYLKLGNSTLYETDFQKIIDINLKGEKGTPGTNGTNGVKGTKGDTGSPGTNGANGVKGTKGDTGSSGTNGVKGTKGDTGSSGTNGVKGAKGNTGSPGTNGTNGLKGAKGNTGSPGTNGANGVKGAKGDTGSPGTNGIKGTKGAKGTQGEAFRVDEFNVNLDDTKLLSIQNTSNASDNDFYVFVVSEDIRTNKTSFGLNGDVTNHVIAFNGSSFFSYGPFTGIQGNKGEAGANGTKGETGTKGAKGAAGADGINGSKGETGTTGAKGVAGTNGSKGETGTTGAKGVAGTNGSKGETGTKGAKGVAGTNGSKGETGTKGAKGVAGTNGSKGETGDKGNKGETGSIDSSSDLNLSKRLFVNDDTKINGTLQIIGNTHISGHILPTLNARFDLGSPEYKIRHLFLSNNSLWVGDEHKIDIQNDNIVFKKRNKNKVPAQIIKAGGTLEDALLHAGKTSIEELTLKDWLSYGKTLNIDNIGIGNADISDIFKGNEIADYDYVQNSDITGNDLRLRKRLFVQNTNILEYIRSLEQRLELIESRFAF